uniref:Putative galacturonosyltransferase 7 isoform X1 n=1 Tax=Rhizophora mucronata TaxID=61149 RepID=A0A2P2L7R5_RHIMU
MLCTRFDECIYKNKNISFIDKYKKKLVSITISENKKMPFMIHSDKSYKNKGNQTNHGILNALTRLISRHICL